LIDRSTTACFGLASLTISGALSAFEKRANRTPGMMLESALPAGLPEYSPGKEEKKALEFTGLSMRWPLQKK